MSLTTQQRRAARLHATGTPIPEVADTLGIHRGTVWRWTTLPAWKPLVARLVGAADQASASSSSRIGTSPLPSSRPVGSATHHSTQQGSTSS